MYFCLSISEKKKRILQNKRTLKIFQQQMSYPSFSIVRFHEQESYFLSVV